MNSQIPHEGLTMIHSLLIEMKDELKVGDGGFF